LPTIERPGSRINASLRSPSAARQRANLERYVLLRAPRRFDVSAAAEAFRALPEIESAEPDYVASQAGTVGSPTSARLMLPGSITSKTMIGSRLSMQNVIAVESITLSPRVRISR